MTDYAPGTSLYNRHVNQYLSDYWFSLPGNKTVANILAPAVDVTKMTDLYKVWGKEHFKIVETRRADKAVSNTVAFGWSDTTYKLYFEALNFEVSEAERENSDDQLSPEFRGIDILNTLIDLKREQRVKTLAEATASVATANRNVVGTTSGFEYLWSDYDAYAANGESGSPMAQLRAMKRQVFASSRVWPNAVILTYNTSETLANNPSYLAKYKNADTSLLTDGGLLPILLNMWVIETSSAQDTAKDGQTASLSNLWTDGTVTVAYIDGLPPIQKGQLITGMPLPTGVPDKYSWLRSFRKRNSRVVRQWNHPEKRNTEVFEVEETIGEQLISSSLAARVTGATA